MHSGPTHQRSQLNLLHSDDDRGDPTPGSPDHRYTPVIGHSQPPASGPDHGQSTGQRIPWQASDIVAGIGLSITGAAAVLVSGVAVDGITGSEPGISIVTSIAITVSAIALSLVIAGFARLPVGTTFILAGFAASANALIYLLSQDGKFLGLSTLIIEQAFTSSVPFGVTWLFVSKKYGRSIRDIGLVRPGKPSAYLVGIAGWFVAVQAVNLWQFLVRDLDFASTPDNTTPVLDIAGGSVFIAWVLSGLLVPFVEEVFFRGFVLRGILSKTGQWPAILLSSAVFAVFHIVPGLYVPTFLLGIAFAWVSLKTRSLWPTIVTHSVQNTLSLLFVSGLIAGQ